MPGFGHDPFGRWPFGESAWGYYTLWKTIPEIYRSQDASGLFQAFIEGLFPSFDYLKRKIRTFDELRDPLLVRSQYDDVERLKLGKVIVAQGATEQSGIDGRVDALQQFLSVAGRFRETDLGKDLFVWNSTVPGNNRSVTLVAIIDLHTIQTTPPLAVDAGPLRWEIREKIAAATDHITVEIRGGNVSKLSPGWIIRDGFADFEVAARRQFVATGKLAYQTEREGLDGRIDGSLTFLSDSGGFTPKDIGKTLSISGSSKTENNYSFEIADVNMRYSPPPVTLKGFLVQDSGPFHWALLPRTEVDLLGTAVPVGVVEQEGDNLTIIGGGSANVSSVTALFTSEDIGKRFDILGSAGGQNGQYEVVAIIDPNTVTLDSTFSVAETACWWELRAQTGTGTIERSGYDLEITEVDTPIPGQHTVVAPSGSFDPTEVGFSLTLKGSSISGNNTTVIVVDVADEETLTVSGTLVLDAGPLTWELESEDLAKQNARAESIIKFMAPDFGLEIDTQESEARQRSLLHHVNAWLDIKGHERGYEILGTISGFDVQVYAAYRIHPSYLSSLDPSVIYEVADEGDRTGTSGELTTAGSEGVLYDPNGTFYPSDEGKSIRLTNASDSDNNGRYHIEEWIDEHTVRFHDPAPAGVTPEYGIGGAANAGTLNWIVIRFYTTVSPTLPNFDEVVGDELTEWVDANLPGYEFIVDKFCWESDYAGYVTVTINSVTNVSGNTYSVNVTGAAGVIPRDPYGGTNQRMDGPFWLLVDGDGDQFVVETAPDPSGADYVFQVVADPTNLPTLGAGTLEYQCHENTSCDFCKASVVVADIQIGSVANESGVAIERVLERVIQRLTEHARPHHVRLIPRFIQTLEAEIQFAAELEANKEIYPILYAAFTHYFDDVPGDEVPLDSAAIVEVETTEAMWACGGV